MIIAIRKIERSLCMALQRIMNLRKFLLLLFFFFRIHVSMAIDTISPGQSLSGNQTIISKAGNFELGFFTPGQSRNYYIGIWFEKDTGRTPVWVANREKPLPDTSSELKLDSDGNLVLVNRSNILIWSSNADSRSPNSTFAVLLDTGNLVLRDGSNSSVVIWQSFDHPTDTWLPGGWLKLNKITGLRQRLISWRNFDDPAPGTFSLQIEQNGTGQYFMLWNDSQRYWRSGVWNGHMFSLLPEMAPRGTGYMIDLYNFRYNFSYVSNDKENYFTFSIINSSIISRTVMDITGQLKSFMWLKDAKRWNLFSSHPGDPCEVYALCGAFGICNENISPSCSCLEGFQPRFLKVWNMNDWSGGCIREMSLNCGRNNSLEREAEDVFLKIPKMRLPVNSLSLTVGNAEECKLACLNICSCNAYAYRDGCSIWRGNLLNLHQLSSGSTTGEDLYLRLTPGAISRSKKGMVSGTILGAVLGIASILGIVVVIIWRCRQKKQIGVLKGDECSLVSFRYRDLQHLTNNFSEKLGAGSFGSVFKGTWPDSNAIAVKKLEGLRQGEKQFRSEVSTIGVIQHINLVRLRGFCSEGTKRLLVCDYMPNGSLDSHLFQKDSVTLDWKTRYQIALGTARGLAYLHEKCRDCIIHCDIKPENILLDDNFCPKVADFGLAKLVGREFSRVLTTTRGTIGYLAPEWILGLAITPKVDVYSYGMMLFEIISGNRNTKQCEDENMSFFPVSAAIKVNQGELLGLLDHRLEGCCNMEELGRLCKVACWCIQDNEDSRPSMGQVVQILEGVLAVSRVELLDEVQLKAINIANGKNLPEVPSLMFEFIGTEAYSREQTLLVQKIVSEHNGSDFVFVEDAEAKKELWKIRKEALWACFAMKPDFEALISDVCVPLSRLAECISKSKIELDASPLVCTVIAHAGDGNFHTVILFDPNEEEQRREAARLNHFMVHTALSMEGTCTGEHGVGTGKMKYLEEELGIESLRTMKRIKAALDPNNIMNPGKLIPPHVCL